MREKAGPKNSKTWAICFPELKDPLGKPLFPTQNAARMFASRWGISTEMLHWTREEVDFLYRTQDIPVRVVKRKLLDEFEKDVTLEQVRYKRKKMKNAGSLSISHSAGATTTAGAAATAESACSSISI